MTAIFVSHRSSDSSEAQALKEWLAAEGHQQLFLDFDPVDGIPAGVDWEQRLYRELRRCQALLVVLTPAWLESKWCSNELAIAREKGKAVFVARVKPCPAGALIPSIQEVDLTCDRESGLRKLARGLQEHGLDPRNAFDWKPGRPIYPGLTAFDVDDASIFFGRSEQSWQAVEALRHLRVQARGSPKLLLITGASGSGKSSVLRAGLLARLQKEPAAWIPLRPIRRGSNGLAALAEAIAWGFPADRRPGDLDGIARRLSGESGAAELLALARDLRFAHNRPEATLVIAIDQAEEMLTAEGGSSELLDLLRRVLTEVEREVVVAATLRSDQLGAWQQHPSVKSDTSNLELRFTTFPLGPIPMTEVSEIVRGPAAYVGLTVDDDLVDALKADTATPDALPLLAYTLRTLHEQHGADGRLRLDEYRLLGGLEGAIRKRADEALHLEALSEGVQALLRTAFVPGLVRAAADGTFSKTRARWHALPSAAHPHLQKLADARLLVIDSDSDGQQTVEIAHEALLRSWPLLERWIWQDAEHLRQLEGIQRAARDYAESGGRHDFLVHLNQRLATAERLALDARFAPSLSHVEREYLAACAGLQRAQNAQQRRRKAAAGAAAMVLLFAIAVGGFFAFGRSQESMSRFVDEAAAFFRAGDLASALVPLQRIDGYPEVLQPDVVPLLRAFWAERMTPFPTFINEIGPLAVFEINGRSVVTLKSGAAHVPAAVGRPLIQYEPFLGVFVFADTQTISLRRPEDFETLIELDVAAISQTEAKRVTPKALLGFDHLGLAVVHTRTLETTNDEDEPQQWHATLTFLFQTSATSREHACHTSATDGSEPAPCGGQGIQVTSGFAAVTVPIKDDADLQTVAWGTERALAIRSSHRTECEIDDDNCEERTIEDVSLVRVRNGRLLLTASVAPESVKADETPARFRIPGRPDVAFPVVQPEGRQWRLARAVPPAEVSAPERPGLDFRQIEEAEHFLDLYDSMPSLNIVRDGSTSVFWTMNPGGNSWVNYSGCRFDDKGLVLACADLPLPVLDAYDVVSADKRFFVQRNCNGFAETLQALDMLRLVAVPIAAPTDFVAGHAISRTSDTLIALTDQNEILTYTISQAGQMALSRRVSLPRETAETGEAACDPGRPLHFVDGTVAIGLSMGGNLFAVDTAAGEVRWFGRSEGLLNARGISVSPDGRFAAVYDGTGIQLVSTDTGLPLTESFAVLSLVKKEWAQDLVAFDTVTVAANGEIQARCALSDEICKDQMFVRAAPAFDAMRACPFELLTGRSGGDGTRLEPDRLLALPRDRCAPRR